MNARVSSTKSKSKYKNELVYDPDYGKFDSKHEHKIFHTLRMRAMAGEVRDLRRQVKFKFGDPEAERYVLTETGKPMVYVADFTLEERTSEGDWRFVVADAKGARTKEYIIKKALMLYFHGIVIREL